MNEASPKVLKPVASRDEAGEFAERTLKNYRYLKAGLTFQGAEVHIVTHLANSLLGLIVFPWEDEFVAPLAMRSLLSLQTKGEKWPKWEFHLGKGITNTLGDLLYHLRNAIAHRRIRFSSDSPVLRDVELHVADYKPNATAPYWRASINCEDLEKFCELLAYEISELR